LNQLELRQDQHLYQEILEYQALEVAQTMILADLVPDILNQITDLLDGFELLGLWFCGCHILNWKLSKGCGATNWKFGWSNKRLPFWPRLLQELPQLHELWLRIDTPSRSYHTLAPQLLNLSPHLKILNCRFPFDHEIVLSAIRMDPERFQNLTTLICEGDGDNESENLFAALKLPSLTKLKFKVNAHSKYTRCTVLLSTLPPSLQSLKLSVERFIIEDDAEFPRNLTSFDLSSDCEHSLLFSKLPPTLLNLRLNLKKGLELEDDWSKFPPNLTSLNLSCLKVRPPQILRLPRGLLHLKLPYSQDTKQDVALAIYQALPPTLPRFPNALVEELNEVTAAALPRKIGGIIHAQVSCRAAHLLPQGVTSISILDCTKEELNEIQGFPSSLTDLSMSLLDERTANLLPPPLLSLAVTDVAFTPSMLISMPPKMTELITVYGCPFNSAEEWKLLGRDLKRLDTAPSIYNDRLGTPISVTCPESSSWLPNRLVFLTIGRLDIKHAEWFSHLPSTLETLRLHVVSIPSDSFLHIHLPKLRELYITATNGLDPDFRLGRPPDEQSIPLANLLRTLPSILEEFTFKVSGAKQWNYCNEDLMNLPPLMRTLQLPESITPITAELLPYLPPKLSRFRNLSWFIEHYKRKQDEEMDSNQQRLFDLAGHYRFPTQGITNMYEPRQQ
jgi:hypothetical protein